MLAQPDHPEAIAPAWLEAMLAPAFPGVAVQRVHVETSSEGTNANALLRVDYKNAVRAPGNLFVKLPPTEPRQRALVLGSGMGQREVFFYRDLAPQVPLRIPAVYGTAIEESDGRFAILIEDLLSSGCSFPDGESGVGLALAERAIDDLAALHCAQYNEDSLARVPTLLRDPAYAARMLEHALATKSHELDPALAAIAKIYIEHGDAVHDLWEAGALVLTHSDGHLANLFVEKGRLGFLDWGCMAKAPAMRDVGYFLCMALSIEDRRRHERDLIRRYLAQRERYRKPAGLDFEAAWEAHRLQSTYTVVAAAPAVLNPREPGDPGGVYAGHFAARASAAVGDLDAEALLRAHLGL